MRHFQTVLTLAILMIFAAPRPATAAGAWSSMHLHKESGLIVAGSDSDRIQAYDAGGNTIWTVSLRKAAEHDLMLVGDVAVITYAAKGEVRALDVRTGEQRWLFEGGKKSAITAGPVDVGGSVVFGESRPSRDAIVVMDAANGQMQWELLGESLAGKVTGLFPVGDAFVVAQIEAGKDKDVTQTLKGLDLKAKTVAWTSPPFKGTFKDGPKIVGDNVVFSMKEDAPADSKTIVIKFTSLNAKTGAAAWEKSYDMSVTGDPRLSPPYVLAFEKGILRVDRVDGQMFSVEKPISDRPLAAEATVELGPLKGDLVYVGIHTPGLDKAPGQVRVVAFDLAQGAAIRAEFEEAGKAGSPLFSVGDNVLLGLEMPGEKPEKLLIALGAEDLKKKWQAKLESGLGEKAPLLATVAGAPLLLVQDGDTLRGLDPAGGVEKWKAPLAEAAAGPVFLDKQMIVGDGDQAILAVDMETGTTVFGPYSKKSWFAWKKASNLAGVLLLSVLIAYFIYHARRGKSMYIRRIAGLAALDEAVGRATEMGKPVLYITGLADVDDIQTLASLSILGHVARRTAEYETPILVPCCRSVVMSTAQEVVKEAHLKAGRPDTFQRENIRYLTDDQFGFVAGVDGIMLRDKPAANFYMGMFYAESLILAETGHSTGAIQIAGTAAAAQLPFFVAACDYTLIGEELYAASAYLSQDPMQIGSLKGQDAAKAVIMAAIVLFCAFYPFYPEIKTWV
ncbi:MAG: hypothetical protein FJX76_16025, partial [Armatimonadetes bacterium]|nr:hypothetical protein [Armatimonadota bacterium]